MDKIYVKARAKVNLTLNIFEKRNDGYHELKSIMKKINLYDELFISKTDTNDISIKINNANIEKEKNILYKTYMLMKELYNISGVDITINKKIPMQAGLGGGSADAADFILAMNKLFNLNLTTEELEETHYSKESLHLITKEEQQVMDFGTKVHEVLEQMDFTNPNEFLEYLPANIQDKIKFFLETPLIKENLSSKMYKEYEFTYQEGNTITHGIIDLLIEREDKMIIADYKLKNIEDAAYDKQLNGYRKVIKEKTSKETECYLYSIVDSTFRKIEE